MKNPSFDEVPFSSCAPTKRYWTVIQLKNASEEVQQLAIAAGVVSPGFFDRIDPIENRHDLPPTVKQQTLEELRWEVA